MKIVIKLKQRMCVDLASMNIVISVWDTISLKILDRVIAQQTCNYSLLLLSFDS